MFTTGSKLFVGATTLALIATAVFAVTTGGSTGWTATLGLLGATIALAFLAGINFLVRDCNVGSMRPDATTDGPASQPAPGASMWPAVSALGGGLVVVGLIATPVVFKAGIVVLLVALVEWMVQAWSERASGDVHYNAAVRKRVLHPLEFPVVGAVGLAVIIYSFSRIMLWVSKEAGPAIFAVLAALIVVMGVLVATKASLKRSVTAGVCSIAALGLVSTGAVMAIDGERSIHPHEIIDENPSVCLSNAETELDHNGSQSLSAKSDVAVTVYFESGKLYAVANGMNGLAQTTITAQRSSPTYVVFRNISDEHVRLTANLGAFATGPEVDGKATIEKPIACTALVDPDGRQFLELTYPKSSIGSQEPYTLVVPGVEGASITVVVP